MKKFTQILSLCLIYLFLVSSCIPVSAISLSTQENNTNTSKNITTGKNIINTYNSSNVSTNLTQTASLTLTPTVASTLTPTLTLTPTPSKPVTGIVTIKIKDTNGNNLLSGTKVYLSDNNNSIIYTAVDSDGNAVFLNTNSSSKYTIFCAYDNVINGYNQPSFYSASIYGSGVFNLSINSLKKVTLSAKKADNSPLTNSDTTIYFKGTKFSYSNILGSTGTGSIYVNANSSLDIRIINKNFGYFYEKNFLNFIGISNVNFSADNSVVKVNTLNFYDSLMSKQTFTLHSFSPSNENDSTDFDTKALKTLYISKNNYTYTYSTTSTDSSGNPLNYNFNEAHLNVSNDTLNLNLGLLLLNLGKLYIDQNNNTVSFSENITDYSGNLLNNINSASIQNTLYDANHVPVDKSKYTFENNGNDNTSFSYTLKGNSSLPSGMYYIEGNASIGQIKYFFSNQNAVYINNSTNINLNVTPPFNTNITEMNYTIYDSTNSYLTGGRINKNSAGSYNTLFNKNYIDSTNTIVITGTSDNGDKFIYSRKLPSSITSNILNIDNSSGKAKKLTFKIDDTSKQNILLDSKITIKTVTYDSIDYNGSQLDSNGVSNLWADDGSYTVTAVNENKHYILSKKLTTSLGNTTAVFSTNNLAKFNVSVSCITGYTFSKMTFNSETSTVNMNLNPGDAVYISPNTDYYFGSLNVYAYDKTIGRDYNYSFLNNSGNYDTSANAVNNINIQDFTVIKDDKFQYYQVSPGSITASYCIESENLTLDNITCNDYYQNTNGFNNLSSNGLYLNLYNSLGKLAASNKYTNNTTSTSGTINNCNLSSGNYNINVMIPQYTKTINSLDVNVTALYVQKVKVMNPFDTTKPLSNGNIHIYYDGVSTNYTLDSNGCAVVAKGTVINPTDIIVSADTSKGMVIYSPNTVPSENEIDITKSISEMKQYSIYPDNLLANSLTKINLANANMKLTNNDLTYSTNLDSTGKKTLYLDGGQYSAVIYGFQNLSNKYYITSTIDAVNNNQTIINTLNTAQITTDKKVNVKLNCDDSLINSIEGSLYVSPNVKIDYSYCDILNNLCYNGTYESTANDKKSLKFGQTITASALIKGTSFKPLDNVNYSISFKDEFNNNVTLSYDQNNYMSAIFTQNEKIAASLSFYVPDGSFTLPENLSGNIKLYFNLDIGRLGVIKTNEINLTANADKYYKISVIDPQGNMSKGGTINLVNTTNGGSRTATYSITSSGLAFIKKSDVQYGTTYNLAINGTVKNTGETFICNKIFNSTITSYKADNCSNVTISTNFNTEVNCIGGNLSIISNGKKIYDSFVNFDANGNATIWLDKSKYDFQLIDSFDTSSYYLSADNIDLNTTSKVIFDGINLCKTHIETSFDKTIISDSSCKYKITAYGSCDVYLPYNLTFNYISTKNKLTYTGSFKTESGKVNNISAGNTIKLSGSLINNNVTNNESVAALLNLSDENNSKIDMGSNSIRTVITQNSEIIQTFYSYSSYYYDNGVKKKCYSFYIPDDMIKGTYQVQFFIDSNDTSDEIKSSIYNFTVNDNKYYNITVNDPSGKPSKGGKITIKNVDYNYDVTSVDIDSNGNANIDKNLFSFSDNCKMFITGYTNSTNELFESVKNFSINTKTYTPNASVKVNCSTIKPADKTIKDAYFGISYGNSLIYKNYIYSSTDIKNSISNYDNFNIYLEKGVFDFYMNLSCTDSSNTTSVYNMTADNIDTTKTDSVTFDSSNTSLVTPINDSGQPLKDFCLQYGWNDKFYTIDFNAITSSPKEYFTKNKLISVKAVNYTERTDDDFIYYKKNILISGDKTDIHYGKGQNTISNNLYFQNTIITGSIFKPNITKITTSDGYTITESSIALDSSTITLNISKDGVLIKSLSGTYGNGITITSSDISSGVYSVQVVISSPVIGQIKSNPTKVLIYNGIDDLCNFYNLSNAGQTVSSSGINIASGNAAIYDGSSKVYDFAKDNNKVLKTSLVSGKSYTISENYLDTSNILRLYTASFNYNEGYTSFYIQEPSTVRTVTITGLPNSIVKITKGTLASSSVLMNSKGTLTAKLDDGTYTITMKGYDASNKYCEVTKTIIVDSSSTSYNLNN